MSSSVTVRGADTLERTARAAARDLRDLTAANRRVAATIRAAAHPPVRTGRLAASLTATADATTATVSSSVRYAPFVEHRRHFLAAALTSSRARTLELYAADTNRAVAGIRGA